MTFLSPDNAILFLLILTDPPYFNRLPTYVDVWSFRGCSRFWQARTEWKLWMQVKTRRCHPFIFFPRQLILIPDWFLMKQPSCCLLSNFSLHSSCGCNPYSFSLFSPDHISLFLYLSSFLLLKSCFVSWLSAIYLQIPGKAFLTEIITFSPNCHLK